MPRKQGETDGPEVVRGEFFTDGETFILRLADTPLSATGATADEAFAALLSVRSSAGALPARLALLAREQQGEIVRAKIIQMSAVALIVLGVAVGTLISAVAIGPRVASEMVQVMAARADKWLDSMPPERVAKLSVVLRKVDALTDGDATQPAATQPAAAQPDAAQPAAPQPAAAPAPAKSKP
jgi:hypothetical protein